jgi:hypothetical protein
VKQDLGDGFTHLIDLVDLRHAHGLKQEEQVKEQEDRH